jgi:hypothetical protein
LINKTVPTSLIYGLYDLFIIYSYFTLQYYYIVNS